jgi:imidazolonepropionase-like amidohydrolase
MSQTVSGSTQPMAPNYWYFRYNSSIEVVGRSLVALLSKPTANGMLRTKMPPPCRERGKNRKGDAMRRHFRNVSIIDASGASPFRGTVTVEGARISAVTRSPMEAGYSGDDEVIDCAGYTMLPGLTESHCHISFNNLASIYQAVEIQPEDHSLIALANAQLLLKHGFTSLFSAASAKPRVDVAVRDAINRGLFEGPRMRAAGQEITPTGNLGDLDTNYFEFPRNVRFSVSCDGADSFMRAARLAARDGVDTIKVNVSGDRDWGHMHADDTVTVITERELQAVMEVANARHLMVASHCTSSSGVKMCVRQGVQVIYHAPHADAEARDMLESVKDRIFVVPAAGLPISMLRRHEEFALNWSAEKIAMLESEVQTVTRCMRDLHARGVRVLPGGDYGAFITNPMGENAKDLEHFVELFGFTPMQAIVAATRHGAELMQMEHEVGQIKAGFYADLMILDGDPLADIGIFQDQSRIVAVMKDGRFAKRDAILSHVAAGPKRKTA